MRAFSYCQNWSFVIAKCKSLIRLVVEHKINKNNRRIELFKVIVRECDPLKQNLALQNASMWKNFISPKFLLEGVNGGMRGYSGFMKKTLNALRSTNN